MCFSATASFVASGITGAIGLVCLSRVRRARDLPLAATPLIFSLQQTIEGLLWLQAPGAPSAPLAGTLPLLYLFIAYAFWPVFAPATVLAVEPSAGRRRLIWPFLPVGLAVAADLLWRLATGPHSVVVRCEHMVYVTQPGSSTAIAAGYLAAIILPLLLSSRRVLVALGVTVLAGYAAAYVVFLESFVSVWCFFAAAASGVVLWHFEGVRTGAAPRHAPA